MLNYATRRFGPLTNRTGYQNNQQRIIGAWHSLVCAKPRAVKTATRRFGPLTNRTGYQNNQQRIIGVWHSLVVRLVRDQEAAGSNPVTPTKVETLQISPFLAK